MNVAEPEPSLPTRSRTVAVSVWVPGVSVAAGTPGRPLSAQASDATPESASIAEQAMVIVWLTV